MENQNLIKFFLLTFISIFAICTALNAKIVEESLISYWSFDQADIEDDIVKDSWGGNNGTIAGEPEIVQGKIGEALEFDGEDDFVDMRHPNDGSFDFGADIDFSIAAWINLSESPSDQYTIVCKGDHGNNPRILFKIKAEQVYITLANEPGGGPKPDFSSNTSVIDSEWHYVVLVVDRDKATQIYIDGALDAEGIASEGTDVTTQSPLFIGKSHQEGSDNRRFMRGIIDEVCIYSKVLREEEIVQNMNAEGLAVGTPLDKLAITWGEVKGFRN